MLFDIPEVSWPSGILLSRCVSDNAAERSPLPFSPDADIQRIRVECKDDYCLFIFRLLLGGNWTQAHERVEYDGSLVDEVESLIVGRDGRSLDPKDLAFVRTLIKHRFFYDIQHLEVGYYWVDPDG